MATVKLKFEPTIPNILTLIRFMAIPVLAWYIYAGDDYKLVAFILFVSIWLTDMLDGYIARRFNQVSDFGKLFDPFVDKIFQLSTAVAMCTAGKLPIWVPLFIGIKELMMVIGSALLFRKQERVVYAEWFGKLATVLFVIAFALAFWLPAGNPWLADVIFILPAFWSGYAYIRYGLSNIVPLLRKKKVA